MATIYTEVEVDVDLDDFDTDDLLEELERRGNLPIEGSEGAKAILEQIYYLRRQRPEVTETTEPQDRPQDTLALVIFWAIVVIFVIGILIA